MTALTGDVRTLFLIEATPKAKKQWPNGHLLLRLYHTMRVLSCVSNAVSQVLYFASRLSEPHPLNLSTLPALTSPDNLGEGRHLAHILQEIVHRHIGDDEPTVLSIHASLFTDEANDYELALAISKLPPNVFVLLVLTQDGDDETGRYLESQLTRNVLGSQPGIGVKCVLAGEPVLDRGYPAGESEVFGAIQRWRSVAVPA